ncbi:MAG: glycogen debranching enzyme N-terminal domain-containing protein, partial [Candidatus Micrarchaeia archaeon]
MLIAMKGISYNEGIKKEWIATNGIGGYASSTIIHANTRGYHGLLVASLQPPIDRHLLLSKLDESITVGGKTYDISTNKFGDLITPRGYNHIVQFRLDPFPTFLYDVDGVMLEKSVFMIHGQNATVVSYAMLRGACEISINVLANSRDFHSRTMGRLEFVENESTKATTLKHGLTALVIGSDKGKYEKLGIWYDGLTYDAERERGLPDRENCYVSGRFVASLCEGEKLNILATGGYEKIAVKTFAKFYSTKPENFDALLQEEKERLQYLLHTFSKRELPKKEMIEQLVLSSDAFIVERKSTNSKSIIAGYHWFGDWGRDTLISLTGLTLVTGRFNDAKSILKTFASYMKNGLVPNTFPEHGVEPIYNTADASLLFSLALYDYYQC